MWVSGVHNAEHDWLELFGGRWHGLPDQKARRPCVCTNQDCVAGAFRKRRVRPWSSGCRGTQARPSRSVTRHDHPRMTSEHDISLSMRRTRILESATENLGHYLVAHDPRPSRRRPRDTGNIPQPVRPERLEASRSVRARPLLSSAPL